MLNKIMIAFFALGLTFSVACGGGETKADEAHTETAVEEVEEVEIAEEEVAVAEEVEHDDSADHADLEEDDSY